MELSPGQSDVLPLITPCGNGFTETEAFAVVVQPLVSCTVTVYVEASLTRMDESVIPLLHSKVKRLE